MQADETRRLIGRRSRADIRIVLDKRLTIGLSIACLASAIIGFLSRSTDWKWTLVVAPSQVMTMMIRGGRAPFFVASFVGSRLRRSR